MICAQVVIRAPYVRASVVNSCLQVREAISADVPALLALDREAPTSVHWSEADYHRLFRDPSGRIALVVQEQSVRGFIVARSLGPEWEIENVVVASSFRRRGLGRRLVQGLLEMACNRRAQTVFLEVRQSNAAARTLYSKLGFAECGRRKAYYQNPEEDALLYRKNLSAVTRERY